MTELNGCKNCGSGLAQGFGRYTQASFSGVELVSGDDVHYVWCGTCGLTTKTTKTPEEAVTLWNEGEVS